MKSPTYEPSPIRCKRPRRTLASMAERLAGEEGAS